MVIVPFFSRIKRQKNIVQVYRMSVWLDHVKKTMKENPGLEFKEVLKKAKKTYKKTSGKSKTIKVPKKSKKSRKSKKSKKSHKKNRRSKKH